MTGPDTPGAGGTSTSGDPASTDAPVAAPTPGEWPLNPVLHELGTWPWLTDLEVRYGRSMTLADVPAEVWDDVARPGVDAVWLMGVWERSPAGAAIARTNPAMVASQREALPDVTDADVVGSAYCIRRYVPDARFGGAEGLAAARAALAARGARLLLDWVPNHVAPDHLWVAEHPEYFVRATPEAIAADPDSFLALDGQVFARGRDPYFPAWPEVLQLDTTAPATRRAAAAELAAVAEQCDGVRCDMAMLVLDDVVARTWGPRATAPADAAGYWPSVMAPVRARHPGFAFFAEAYWGLEGALLDAGFDACYDKTLYDRLVHGDIGGTRAHLAGADPAWQRRTVRFLENHDEPRAAAAFASDREPARQRAAALLLLSTPGVALLHEGQFEGRRVRVPVTLGRRPDERPDVELAAWYRRLLDRTAALGLRRGSWAWCEPSGWPDNRSCEQLGAWCWNGPAGRHLVVVDLGGQAAQARIPWPWPEDGPEVRSGRPVGLRDLLTDTVYERDGAELLREGLYVGLDPYGGHLFAVD